MTCFNCGRQGHRVADCWSPKQISQGKGKQPGKYSGKRSGKAATGKNSHSPGGGKPIKGKGKDGKGKTQFGKSGKKTGKGIYSLDENAAEANPNETWPDSEEPYHEIGSLFTLAGNHPETKIGPERTQKYRSSEGKGRNGEKIVLFPSTCWAQAFRQTTTPRKIGRTTAQCRDPPVEQIDCTWRYKFKLGKFEYVPRTTRSLGHAVREALSRCSSANRGDDLQAPVRSHRQRDHLLK